MTAAIRDAVGPDLRQTLRALKLGQMMPTLPDRLTLARQQKMTHADFLELVLADGTVRDLVGGTMIRQAEASCLGGKDHGVGGIEPGGGAVAG